MVMVTRSSYRKACESSHRSEISEKNIIPPWCSSRKVYESRKPRKLVSAKWEIRSTYPLRENIWEYLYEDNDGRNFGRSKRRNRRACKQIVAKDKKCLKITILILVLLGTLVSLWMANTIPNTDLITKVVPNCNLISLLGIEEETAVSINCCQRLQYLTEELSRTEEALRNTLRLRRNMMLTWRRTKSDTDANKEIDTRYIEGATASKGSDTTEWGARVALWGIVPLWRAAPPPRTVLALRPPTLADCWPFIGSFGELVIRLPNYHRVRYISVEHIRPDTARSAPKHFALYGILANSTRIKVVNGQYRADGPAKQYYPIADREAPLKSLVFQVLTNQGNEKYTCVYRVHLYGSVVEFNDE